MSKFRVIIPIVGYIYKEVDAETKEDAIDIALEEEIDDDEIMELEMYDKLVNGNICYTNHTEAYSVKIK